MRILVTGASGLLGLNFCLNLAESQEITGITHTNSLVGTPFKCVEADLAKKDDLFQIVETYEPDLIVHCAAMANVDACEKDPEQAKRINSDLPGELASICKEGDIRLVHVSTDAVFDGKKGDYSEEDDPNPLSVYAVSKLEGERKVIKNYPDALVVRVNFYGFSLSGSRSLAEFFLNQLSQGHPVNGFVDVMFCPLYVADLVDVLIAMASKRLKGLFHAVSSESLSKYAFGLKIAEKFGFERNLIQPVSVVEGNLTARRSLKLSLNTEKLLGEKIILPDQNSGLDRFYQDYLSGLPEKIKSFSA